MVRSRLLQDDDMGSFQPPPNQILNARVKCALKSLSFNPLSVGERGKGHGAELCKGLLKEEWPQHYAVDALRAFFSEASRTIASLFATYRFTRISRSNSRA